MRSRLLVVAVQILAAVVVVPTAQSQTSWPNKPITMILQSPPGGSQDIIARLLQAPIQESLGQPMVIETKLGSLGIPAGIAVAKSGTDGHTFGMFATTFAAAPSLQKTLPYDPLRDFTPVALLVKTPTMIAVNPAVPIKTIGELIAIAKAKPGGLNYGSSGLGTGQHFAGEALKLRAGMDMVHVPYRGAGPALIAALSGEISIVMTVAGPMAQYINSGKLRPLAVSGSERLPLLPGVPTIAEQGFPEFAMEDWFGVVGAAGIPAEAVRRMNAALNQALRIPAVADRLRGLGFQLVSQSPEQFRSFIEAETKKLRGIIQGAKISIESGG